jgi:dipeptidyl aminopeptidase/acylaminoacyl peptidase
MSYKAKYALTTVVTLLILVVAGSYAVISVIIFNKITLVQAACANDTWAMNNTPSDFRQEDFDTPPYFIDVFEDVSFSSREDNLRLDGWFIPAGSNTRLNHTETIIVVHGHNGCKQSAAVLTAAGMLSRNGFNVLAIDLREHGYSQIDDGRTMGGLDEYRDVLGAWDWLRQEKHISPARIGLMGFSLGAATVIIAAGEEPDVAAVWEDSSFADINQIVSAELSRNNFPAIFGPATSIVSRLLTGTDLLSYSPIASLRNVDGRPYFIVHGSADQRIGVEHAAQLAEAIRATGGRAETWIVAEAGHTRSIFLKPDEYEARLVTFFDTALAGN